MSRIFISYRRDDITADMTDRLYERLVRRWGRRVFMDIDSLVGGDLFAKAIEENLQNCAVVLVIIGRHWLWLTNEQGMRRIDDPGDYPRMEVAAALRRGIRVIPVLVGGAPLPKPEELPQDIAGLLDRQIVRVSRERFDADVQQLVAAVAREMPRRSWRDLFKKETLCWVQSPKHLWVAAPIAGRLLTGSSKIVSSRFTRKVSVEW
jgi:hypothetical protein